MSDPHQGVGVGRQGTIETVSVSQAGVDRLKPGAIGLFGVIFVAVTGAAPISAMLFNVPFATGFGTGFYTPAAFLFAAVVLTIFSVGYVTMAREIHAAGGFYSFISHAFGPVVGMGAAITMALAYTVFAAANVGVTAYFAQTNIASWTNGSVELPIALIYAVLIVLMTSLAYFHIELTARVLGVCLVAEVLALVIFDVFVGVQGGASGIPMESLNPFAIIDNADAKLGLGALAGVAFFGAFWSWVGFEMAPNYAEESKEPKKMMAPATYISVIGLGVLYTITCWMFVAGWGPMNASQAIASQFGLEGFEPLANG